MDDEWSNLPIDPNTGVPVISIGGSNPLPVQSAGDAKDAQAQPAFADVDVGSPTSAADVETGPLAKLFGIAGNERYQTWPEKLVRSAVTAPADAMAGNITPDQEIPRALDLASFAGVGPLAMKPGTATLGSGMTRMVTNDVAPVFYSAVENAVKDAKLNVGTADQWLGYLKDQPGVKEEELDWTLGDLLNNQQPKQQIEVKSSQVAQDNLNNWRQANPKQKPPQNLIDAASEEKQAFIKAKGEQASNQSTNESLITKDEIQAHVDANKVQLSETNKGQDVPVNTASKYYQIPEVAKIADNATSPKDFYMTLANTQDAYKAVKKAYPNVGDDEQMLHWARNVAKDVMPENDTPTKFQSYQLPGASNYQEKLLTLPEKNYQAVNDFNIFKQQLEIKHNTHIDSAYDAAKITGDKEIGKQYQNLLIEAQKVQGNGGLNFKSSHWDEPNVLAHVRMNDRYVKGTGWSVENKTSKNARMFGSEQEAKDFLATLPDSLKGNVKVKEVPNGTSTKTLHLEEIQSDWHQKGRAEGYKITPEQKTQLENLDQKLMNGLDEKDIGNPDMAAVLKTAQEKGVLTKEEAKNYADWSKGENSSIPNAPFKSSWSDLALKRMIRHASENGYDAISWTPGEAQAARYDLSKHVDVIHYSPQTKELWAHKGSNRVLNETNVPPEKLADYIGKEPAKKILDEPPDKDFEKYGKEPVHTLSGLDLKIGGEGMKAFYDKMLVDKANNIAKKYGGRVEDKDIGSSNKNYISKEDDGWTVTDPRNENESDGPFSSKKEAEAFFKERYKQFTLNNQPIHFLKLPQSLKDTALSKGFPLFAGGFPISAPLQHDPFQHSVTPDTNNNSGLDENVTVNGKTIPINNKQDVPDLAGASSNDDTVNIDKSVPRYDAKFKLKNGDLGDIHKYLAIHETTEKTKMNDDIAAFVQKNNRQPNAEEMHKIYLNAHYGTATPAEHAAIIADGGNPKDYEDVLHGYERKTENEKSGPIPANLYRQVYGHNQLRGMTLTPVKESPF